MIDLYTISQGVHEEDVVNSAISANKIPRENGFQFRKIRVGELVYVCIGDCQTYPVKIKKL